MNRKMPPELMAKFLVGVSEDTAEDDTDWEVSSAPRPTRLALGADPKALNRKKETSVVDRKITNLMKKNQQSDSSSDDEGSRANIGHK